MLDALHRFLGHRHAAAEPEAAAMEAWARQKGAAFKRVRRGPGAVISLDCESGPMRIEWGPPQRDYIRGSEIRVRVDAHLPEALEMLVLTRSLVESLEAQAYRQLISDRETEIDASTPMESRWLALFERIDVEAADGFRRDFVVLSSCVPHARHWAQGELSVRLMRSRARWLAPEAPLVLMTLRGRLYLRAEAGAFDETLLDGVYMLAEAAARRARKISTRAGRVAGNGADERLSGASTPSLIRAGDAATLAEADAATAAMAALSGACQEAGVSRALEVPIPGSTLRAASALSAGTGAASAGRVAGTCAAASATAQRLAVSDFIDGLAATEVSAPSSGLDFDEFLAQQDADLPTELPPLGGDIPTDLQL